MNRRIASGSPLANLCGAVAMLGFLLVGVSCEGEKRPYTPPMRGMLAATPAAAGSTGAPNVVLDPDAAVPCEQGELQLCGPETSEGVCEFGSRKCQDGVWSDCVGAVYPAERDCSSAADNDCDGQPDNLVDDTCRCEAGSMEPCETHPGQDGVGACRAGQRACVLAVDRRSSDWGACEGSVGPAPADSCSMSGDDADCDGTPNGGCPCVEGTTRPCGPSSDTGLCEFGVSRCVGQVFTTCVGATLPVARDCGSSEDNDCDGLPDNTVDSVCSCALGDTQPCGEHPGQDGKWRCQAGTRRCEPGLNGTTSRFGACTGSVAPLAADLCTVRNDDSNCDGVLNGGCQCITGDRTTCGQLYGSLGVCSGPALVCGNDGRWPAASSCAATGPEVCSNNLDDDCDGQVNEADACAQCTPGESLCVDSRTAKTCSTSGAFVEQTCPVQCARGRCVDPIHDSGLVGCDVTDQLVCDTLSEQCCEPNGILTPGTCVASNVDCQTRFVQCDGPSDCPTAQVCCFQTNPAVESLTCKPATDCVDAPPNTTPVRGQRRRIVCDPSNPQCPSGSQCLQTGFPFVDMVFYHCTPAGEVP
jgi:hypothetical protein